MTITQHTENDIVHQLMAEYIEVPPDQRVDRATTQYDLLDTELQLQQQKRRWYPKIEAYMKFLAEVALIQEI